MGRYVVKGGKKLRYGYTTGSCAAAAAKAAAVMLTGAKNVDSAFIDTPKGWRIEIKVHGQKVEDGRASCFTVKDAGDDPDVTNGIRIYAQVELCEGGQVHVTGGDGIGRVTKKGVGIEVGEYAINRTPLDMIKKEVRKVIGERAGAIVRISAPQGKEIAKRTFNPRLGIEGGISIIGTSGIVEPMSEDAVKESMLMELNVIRETGAAYVVFSPGNYGRDFCLSKGIDDSAIVKTSNYTGFMIEAVAEMGFEGVLVVGHIGKLVKLAAGIFNTHSRVADARMETMTALCALRGADSETARRIMECITTEEAVDIVMEQGLGQVFCDMADRVALRCSQHSYDRIEAASAIFSQSRGLLAVSSNAAQMLSSIRGAGCESLLSSDGKPGGGE